ncbi:MAG: 3-oxoacyl-ACP reductase [Cytophagaceae bacterium SCN 52-12]|nr:MAG: 3-oxoacyl-ACP reductase [Cytophagaceae bacterium SCN 52-12]
MAQTPKKALVTGASRGIGKAIALALAKKGCEVGIHFRDKQEEAEQVAGEIAASGGRYYLFRADFSRPEEVTALADNAWTEMGGIDYLVNNAGVSYKTHFLDATPEDIELFLNVNFKATFILTQSIARKMVESGAEGSIYTITSVNGLRPGLGLSAYGASKGALEIIMQGAALELAPHHIRVNTIAVGAVQTDINAAVWQNPELLEKVNEGIPMKRFGQPEEIAAVIADLLDSGSYMTGSTIVIDGGLLLMRGYGKPERYDKGK